MRLLEKAIILFEKTKILVKSKFDVVDNERLKKNLLNALPFWLGALLSGGLAVLYAKLFSLAEAGTHLLFDQFKWAFFVVTPACFVLAWWLVVKYAPYARGSGIPQVTAAIELANPKQNILIDHLLSLRILFIKICSSLIMVLGGGAIGREGPTIQISAAIFKKINDLLPEWYPKISKRNMLVTGAASGLAAAFNTPLGGIVFAIEELTKTHFSLFRSALLTGVIIAGLTALNFLGPYLYLGYPDLKNLSFWLLVMVIPLALVTGYAGNGMGHIILSVFKKKQQFKKRSHKILYVIICGLILAATAIFLERGAFGSGKELMISTLFTDHKSVSWYLPIVRIVGPILSFTTGAAGGIFAPSLSAGASIGALFAELFNLSSSDTNLMILCGMTGFLSGVTRSPFTSSILVLEMTNSHAVIFYIMLTALLANLFATISGKHSFYDQLKIQYLQEITHGHEPHEISDETEAPNQP